MPGTNHDIDPSFMDNLDQSLRDPALELIRFSSLKDMLEMRLKGPSEFLAANFDLSQQQWHEVLNKVILTKVSYFDMQVHFPNRYIDKLIEIACYAASMDHVDPIVLYQAMLKDHPIFAAWLKKAIQTKQLNIRFEQQRLGETA
ncbi:hypothetical protein [Thiomicrorhabdus sediminis]|uniref:Uncharacterized protein n=1 Tax=Thiomicrorhabdus sediminis TaxID=2580412 RepID=A0A4P9K6Z1_9GAMM|nr:hypothetical protein [Thiomicrorhabdus sediminis]QCU90852.1 hypothetical protein FE785_09535 [Thiomicrorhabdus sediminis]